MQNKIKNVIITIGFILILFIVFFLNIISKDKEISISERRKLAQFPEITFDEIIDGSIKTKWEKYAEDQFVNRDFFRKIKTFYSLKVFKQKDNNNLFEKDGAIYKIEYPLKENSIEESAQKVKNIYDKYLRGMNVYYSIIPDKNYYLENDDYLKFDYNKIEKIVSKELTELNYIDIKNSLDINDFYKTDLHWKQENLQDVVSTIKENMNVNTLNKNNSYEKKDKGDFYGIYYGQLEVDVTPDKLYILTNNIIEQCSTYNYETRKIGKIYDENKSADKYDIFLSGATPLITIENPNATTNRELLLFRDSFGSSIAPLLIESYKKITLIDMRYMSSEILGDYIKFNNQDVLFLYSSLILNQNILR